MYGMSRHILGVFVLLGQITNTRASYNLVPVGSCPTNQLMVAVSFRSQGSWQENDSGEFEKYYNVRCDTCADGKFKAAENYQYRYEFDWFEAPIFPSCAECASNLYKASGQTSCQSCPENTESVPGSTSLASCVYTGCPAGSYGSDSQTCTQCISGKYKATADRSLCTNCPGNSHSIAGSDAQTDCTCNSGYIGTDGSACTACDAGKYKIQSGNADCTDCETGTYSATIGAATNECLPCPVDSYSIAGSDAPADCTCNSGYTGTDGDACTACDAGKYHIATTDTCTPCTGNSHSVAGSDAQADCTCNSGYTGTDGDACTACDAGKYHIATTDTCTPCTRNSHSVAGSDAQADCTCNSGYTGTDGSACTACESGKYTSASGNTPCEECPAMYSARSLTDAHANKNPAGCLQFV